MDLEEARELKRLGREKFRERQTEKADWKFRAKEDRQELLYLKPEALREILRRFGIAGTKSLTGQELVRRLECEVRRF